MRRSAEPRPVSFLDLSGPRSRGTHWVGFTVGMHAYLSTGTPDSRPTHPLDDQFPVIVDLARPDRPAEVGRWWLPGTQESDGSPPPVRHEVFDAGFRAHNINVCAARPDRAYVGYLDAGAVILDISDAASPAMSKKGVSVAPGQRASTRRWRVRYSSAKACEKDKTKALLAPYTAI